VTSAMRSDRDGVRSSRPPWGETGAWAPCAVRGATTPTLGLFERGMSGGEPGDRNAIR